MNSKAVQLLHQRSPALGRSCARRLQITLHDIRPVGAAARVLAAGCLLTLPLIPGCASGGPPSNPARTIASEGSTRRVTGDWNDVESAALVGTNKAEAVVRTQTINTATLQEFDLRTVLDQRGTLRISRAQSDTDGESSSIELWCHVGSFGDQAREERILEAVAERFTDLRGVEFAPIR